jgi:hypothetical protein
MYFFRKRQNETAFYGNTQLVGYTTFPNHPKLHSPDNPIEMFDIIRSSNILIKTEVVMLSCVINAQFFVAKMMGYGAQYLVGVDMSYPENRYRFTSWGYTDGKWRENKAKPLDQIIAERPTMEARHTISKEGVATDRVMIFFKRNVMTAWRLELADLINTYTDKEKGIIGILRELPAAYLPDVIASEGRFTKKVRSIPNKEKARRSEQYMADQDTYCVPFSQGFRFVESPNPERELVIFLDKSLAANAPFRDDEPPEKIMRDIMRLRPDKFPNGVTWNFEESKFKRKSEMVKRAKKILDHEVEPTPEAFKEMVEKWVDFYGEPAREAFSSIE